MWLFYLRRNQMSRALGLLGVQQPHRAVKVRLRVRLTFLATGLYNCQLTSQAHYNCHSYTRENIFAHKLYTPWRLFQKFSIEFFIISTLVRLKQGLPPPGRNNVSLTLNLTKFWPGQIFASGQQNVNPTINLTSLRSMGIGICRGCFC